MNMKTKIVWRFVINGGYIDGCIESIDWLLQEMIRFNLRFIKQNFGNIGIGTYMPATWKRVIKFVIMDSNDCL